MAELPYIGLSWPLTNRHLLGVALSTFTTIYRIHSTKENQLKDPNPDFLQVILVRFHRCLAKAKTWNCAKKTHNKFEPCINCLKKTCSFFVVIHIYIYIYVYIYTYYSTTHKKIGQTWPRHQTPNQPSLLNKRHLFVAQSVHNIWRHPAYHPWGCSNMLQWIDGSGRSFLTFFNEIARYMSSTHYVPVRTEGICTCVNNCKYIYIALSLFPIIVTTRMIICFRLGDPNLNLHLPLAFWEVGTTQNISSNFRDSSNFKIIDIMCVDE